MVLRICINISYITTQYYYSSLVFKNIAILKYWMYFPLHGNWRGSTLAVLHYRYALKVSATSLTTAACPPPPLPHHLSPAAPAVPAPRAHSLAPLAPSSSIQRIFCHKQINNRIILPLWSTRVARRPPRCNRTMSGGTSIVHRLIFVSNQTTRWLTKC